MNLARIKLVTALYIITKKIFCFISDSLTTGRFDWRLGETGMYLCNPSTGQFDDNDYFPWGAWVSLRAAISAVAWNWGSWAWSFANFLVLRSPVMWILEIPPWISDWRGRELRVVCIHLCKGSWFWTFLMFTTATGFDSTIWSCPWIITWQPFIMSDTPVNIRRLASKIHNVDLRRHALIVWRHAW